MNSIFMVHNYLNYVIDFNIEDVNFLFGKLHPAKTWLYLFCEGLGGVYRSENNGQQFKE